MPDPTPDAVAERAADEFLQSCPPPDAEWFVREGIRPVLTIIARALDQARAEERARCAEIALIYTDAGADPDSPELQGDAHEVTRMSLRSQRVTAREIAAAIRRAADR